MTHHPIRPACSYGLATRNREAAECVGEDCPGQTGLFLLMTVFSQSFLTLVRSHLVAFSFLSAGHNINIFII